jgi:hypothetical protein
VELELVDSPLEELPQPVPVEVLAVKRPEEPKALERDQHLVVEFVHLVVHRPFEEVLLTVIELLLPRGSRMADNHSYLYSFGGTGANSNTFK